MGYAAGSKRENHVSGLGQCDHGFSSISKGTGVLGETYSLFGNFTGQGFGCDAFDGSFANPLHLQRPAAEFADAKFIVPHLGSGLLRELLMLADQAPNVYADTSGVAGWATFFAVLMGLIGGSLPAIRAARLQIAEATKG